MPIVYLLRHAQSSANVSGILAGQDNSVELSKYGFKQAENLVNTIEMIKPTKIFSSPLLRCIQTIDPYIQSRRKIKILTDSDLIEMDYGQWSGRKLSALQKEKNWKKVQKNPAQFTFPKGESFINLHARVRKFQVKLYGEKGPILVVSHGDVIKMFLASVAGLEFNSFQKFVIEPGSISAISIEKSSSKIISTNNLNFSPIKQSSIKDSLGGGNTLSRKFFGAIK